MRILKRLYCRIFSHDDKFLPTALYNRGLDIYKDVGCRRCGRIESRLVMSHERGNISGIIYRPHHHDSSK